MQLGMIGLGRMGATMVRRLIKEWTIGCWQLSRLVPSLGKQVQGLERAQERH